MGLDPIRQIQCLYSFLEAAGASSKQGQGGGAGGGPLRIHGFLYWANDSSGGGDSNGNGDSSGGDPQAPVIVHAHGGPAVPM